MYDFTYVENVAHAHICAERALASEGAVADKASGQVAFVIRKFTVVHQIAHKAVLLPENGCHGIFCNCNHACRHISSPMQNRLSFGSSSPLSLKVLATKGILLYHTLSI